MDKFVEIFLQELLDKFFWEILKIAVETPVNLWRNSYTNSNRYSGNTFKNVDDENSEEISGDIRKHMTEEIHWENFRKIPRIMPTGISWGIFGRYILSIPGRMPSESP